MAEPRTISRNDSWQIVTGVAPAWARFFLWMPAIPLLLLASALYMLRQRGIRRDFAICRRVLSERTVVPTHFVELLIISEDHRSRWHLGVDPLAIIRVLVKNCYSRTTGGASTIEQQFVRTVLSRYEKTFARKLHEQLVATLLACTISRDLIAKKYLEIAYFGTGKVGVHSFEKIFGCPLQNFDMQQVIGVMARLKYPEPRTPTTKWCVRFDRRCLYIENLVRRRGKFRDIYPEEAAKEVGLVKLTG